MTQAEEERLSNLIGRVASQVARDVASNLASDNIIANKLDELRDQQAAIATALAVMDTNLQNHFKEAKKRDERLDSHSQKIDAMAETCTQLKQKNWTEKISPGAWTCIVALFTIIGALAQKLISGGSPG